MLSSSLPSLCGPLTGFLLGMHAMPSDFVCATLRPRPYLHLNIWRMKTRFGCYDNMANNHFHVKTTIVSFLYYVKCLVILLPSQAVINPHGICGNRRIPAFHCPPIINFNIVFLDLSVEKSHGDRTH